MCDCRCFYIDKTGEGMTELEQQRLNHRAQRFAADGNRTFKKKLSVAELVQAAVSTAAYLCHGVCEPPLFTGDGIQRGGRSGLAGFFH